MFKLGKLGCLGCGGAALLLIGFTLAVSFVPARLEAGTRATGSVHLIERNHDTTPGWTVQQEVDGDGVRHGEHTVWEDDRLVLEGYFENDLEEGVWRYWHANGQLSQELTYRQGQAEGAYRHWHDNGRLAVLGAFRGGIQEGPWLYWTSRGSLDADQTGFFVGGDRVRELTDDEIEAATR